MSADKQQPVTVHINIPAAQVILGRAANGRIEWINDKGKSIKDLEVEAMMK
jgi:hypothetical protein